MAAEPLTCAVCGDDEPNAELLEQCFECGDTYHLNPYSNRPGRDCGDAVIGETLGVHYYCERCLQRMDGEPSDPADAMARPMETSSASSSPADGPLSRAAPEPSSLPPRAGRPARRRRYRRIDRP